VGIIYFILKHGVRIGLKVFFRKIFFSNQDLIPKKGPTIFALNHPTAFIDPMVLASIAQPSMHFMLRGDMFKSSFAKWFLNQIHAIPIFRFRDGFANLKNNTDTMQNVYKKLNEGGNIIILAEGNTKHEKKMRPIQKGAARMAFGAFEKFGRTDINIVPVGVNYTDSDVFRSDVMLDFGPAIEIEDYLDTYRENSRTAIKEVTEEVSKRMRERIVHIEDSEREPMANVLLEMKRNLLSQKILPIVDSNRTQLQEEWDLAEKVNGFSNAQFEKIESIATEYKSLVHGLSLKDKALSKLETFNWRNSLILLIGLLPFLVGVILNILPVLLANKVAEVKVKKIEFGSSVRFAVGFFGWIFYYLLVVLILNALGWYWWMILAIPFLGYFALVWIDLFKVWNGARTFADLPKSVKEEFVELRDQLLEVINS